MFLVSFLILLFAAWWVPFRFCRLLKLKTKHGLWASAGILPLSAQEASARRLVRDGSGDSRRSARARRLAPRPELPDPHA